ncbi:hypothetical protein P6144_17515 [Sphingomonas sp. HITSZ_GF]|uniref:transferrin-binding protein-like solute binding protein n=1 Tax=Sphingomonas sp. HITSZ_GF TaxID=3037247 RepID=UPI00240DA9EC|nr:transferrin-binding protein-like solute binding protein [Sphingomonas sp. HITSZ_GF]MDG2535464.1 hypothetical protein [Sphingomonas sp. HITSZ_GF]
MIRRHMFMSALAATFALSGCGGGDDDSATATPTATPTPTPTASPTYASLPLTAATEFYTFNATTSYTGDPATSAVTLGAASTETLSTRVKLATDTAIATGTYVMDESTEESRFCVPTGQTCTSTLVANAIPANQEFIFRTDDTTTAGKFAQAEFLNNVVTAVSSTGVGPTSNTALALSRVSYANWWRGDSTAGQKRLTYTTWGYATTYADMPTTGTVAYSTLTVTGRLVSTVGTTTTINKVIGTVTMSVNFATGQVDSVLTLSTIPAGGGAAVAYGTFGVTGAIPVGQNQWTGSFTTGSPLSGTLVGGFFGSQGEQVGTVFSASGTFGGAQQRLIGVIVGKK